MGTWDHVIMTRLIVHFQDAILNGCQNCLVRTVDTDVVVIIIGKFHHNHYAQMSVSGLQEKTFPIITLIHCMNIWEGRNHQHSLYFIVLEVAKPQHSMDEASMRGEVLII